MIRQSTLVSSPDQTQNPAVGFSSPKSRSHCPFDQIKDQDGIVSSCACWSWKDDEFSRGVRNFSLGSFMKSVRGSSDLIFLAIVSTTKFERYYFYRIFLAIVSSTNIYTNIGQRSYLATVSSTKLTAIIGQDLLSDCLRNKIWALL